jgi:hypothetical protein
MNARYNYLNTDDIRDGLRRIGRRDLLRAIDAKVNHLPDRAPPPRRLPLLRRLRRKLRRLRPLRP